MEDLLYLVSDWTFGDWLLLVLWLCVFLGVVRFFLRPRFPVDLRRGHFLGEALVLPPL